MGIAEKKDQSQLTTSTRARLPHGSYEDNTRKRRIGDGH